MKLKNKMIIVLAISTLFNAVYWIAGIQPTGGTGNTLFSGLVLTMMLVPVITCILAGVLAGTNLKRDFWLPVLPVLINLAVSFLLGGFNPAWIEINAVLGVLPGLIAMGITALICRKKAK